MSSASPIARAAPITMLAVASVGALAAPAWLFGPHAGPAWQVAAGVSFIAVLTLAALGAGRLFARLLRLPGRPAVVELPLESALGAAALAGVAGALGAVGGLRPLSLTLVLLAFAAAGVLPAVRLARRVAGGAGRPSLFPLVVLVAGGVVTFLIALAPAPFYDQFHYHLAFPERWLLEGRIAVHERHSYSYFPANTGLLYLYALAGPGVAAAQLVHWWCGALAALAAGALARLCGGPRAAYWRAVALFASVPSVLLLSGWAGSDLSVAAFGGAAWLALLGARRANAGTSALAAGLLGGAAFGSKYIAGASVVVPLAAGAIVVAFAGRHRSRRAWRRAAVVIALLALGGVMAYAPWGVRNLRLTGDPVYPFLAERLSLAEPDDADAVGASGIASPVEPGSRLGAALTLRAFAPQGDAGATGAVWLLLLPAWIGSLVVAKRRNASLALLAGSVVGVVAWSQFHQLGRYLVPLLVLLSAGGASAWSLIEARLGRAPSAAFTALIVLFVAWGVPQGADALSGERLAITLGRADPDALMKRYVSYWPLIPVVNRDLPHEARVLLVAESRTLHLERDVLVEDPFRTPLLAELAAQERSARGMAGALARSGVTHVLWNRHEADRIRRMTGRDAYFEPRSEEAAEALRTFFERCLSEPVHEGPVSLFSLDRECGATATAVR